MNKDYLVKHWLWTLVVAPFIPFLYELIFSSAPIELGTLLGVSFFCFVASLFLSLPTVLIYFIVFDLLIKYNVNPLLSKFLLISLTILGIAATVLLIGGSTFSTIVAAYSLATIITGLIIKIKIAAVKITD